MIIQQSNMAAMGEMIGNIAHQWRQPLNILMISKDLMVDDYMENDLTKEQMRAYSDQATTLLEYLSKTIDDFRNFFRPSKERTVFDVTKAMKEALAITHATLENAHIDVRWDVPYDRVEVDGFESEFKQVVINLLNNAKDALIERKIAHKIVRIHVESEEQTVSIRIGDNGGGIPDEIIGRIFEPYFTTKFKSQGTGIGLYMSKTIIEHNMNGTISVSNGADRAIFTIILPKAPNA